MPKQMFAQMFARYGLELAFTQFELWLVKSFSVSIFAAMSLSLRSDSHHFRMATSTNVLRQQLESSKKLDAPGCIASLLQCTLLEHLNISLGLFSRCGPDVRTGSALNQYSVSVNKRQRSQRESK